VAFFLSPAFFGGILFEGVSMSQAVQHGVLVPVGGGDPIPLLKDRLIVGRRPSCDIHLSYPNVSGTHCELIFQNGYWTIQDLNSQNGVKVKGERVVRKALNPGDELSIASHKFTIRYEKLGGGALNEAINEAMDADDDLFAVSLLKKAGLEKDDRRSRR
jgi:pSer/pThr/pTyr-binding forkhead associated (FHA) protein